MRARVYVNPRMQLSAACASHTHTHTHTQEWTQRDAEKQQDVAMLEQQVQRAMDEVRLRERQRETERVRM